MAAPAPTFLTWSVVLCARTFSTGGAVAAGTADYDGCIPVNAPMTLTLNRPLTVKAGAKAPF